MGGQRTMSVQKAVHMIHGQELTLCSDSIINISIQHRVTIKNKINKELKGIISRYSLWDYASIYMWQNICLPRQSPLHRSSLDWKNTVKA